MPDPAAGKFEVPGGHLEQGESARAAAIREWQEETGLNWPDGEWTGTWTAGDGIYQGFVYTIAREADLDIFDRQIGSDPDGDVTGTETIAWWDPADLPGNPAVRPELLDSIGDVLAALGCTPDCCGAECCAAGCCDGAGGCTCGTGGVSPSALVDTDDGTRAALETAVEKRRAELAAIGRLMKTPPGAARGQRVRHRTGSDDHLEFGVAKAGDESGPKGRKARCWPGWRYDLQAAEHWAPKITAAVLAALPASQLQQIARDYLAEHSPESDGTGKRELNDQATAWLREHAPDLAAAIAPLVADILADAYLIGAVSAAAVTSGSDADTGGWQPGDTGAAEGQVSTLGLGDDYADTTGTQSGDRAGWIAGGILAALGRTLADGLLGGSGTDDLASDLADTAGDTGLVSGLIGTVITGIASLAAKAWYLLTGVQNGVWITAGDGRVCATCQANADAGEVPIGSPYPSGDTDSPAHNRCRCQVIPA